MKKTGKAKEFKVGVRPHSAKITSENLDLLKCREISEASRTRSVTPTPRSTPACNMILEKFFKIYSKIVDQLKIVKNLTENKLNKIENVLDFRRQVQRAEEFAIRFSRNNLYETKRALYDIKKLVVPYPFENCLPKGSNILCKKLILGYQAASQSLQIYINYIKNPGTLEVPEKICELVVMVSELFSCCENFSLRPEEILLKNDGIRLCNELLPILKSKPPVGEYIERKPGDAPKNKVKPVTDDNESGNKFKKLSMYKGKTKLNNICFKKSGDSLPKKKFGSSSTLGYQIKQMKKREDKKDRITHEIYTQKFNSRVGTGLGNIRNVKPELNNKLEGEKLDNISYKKVIKRRGHCFTPREVRSQDDDVETMVQSIKEEVPVSQIFSPPEEVEQGSEDSISTVNSSSLRELLMDTIEELKGLDKQGQNSKLKKLLNSLRYRSKICRSSQEPLNCSKVKVFHFKHDDTDYTPVEQSCIPDGKRNKVFEVDKEKELESLSKEEVKLKHSFETEVKDKKPELRGTFKKIKDESERNKVDNRRENKKIVLALKENVKTDIITYKKSFLDYTHSNIFYKKKLGMKPWELLEKVSDQIVFEIIRGVAVDFENDALLKRLYANELLDII